MTKGLALARTFYAAGHDVIGADFEPHQIPVNGRFSRSLRRFYRLEPGERYVASLKEVFLAERIELWVSCSGVASAVEDGIAAEVLGKHGVQAVQFGVEVTSMLHEKDSFIKNTAELGLSVPQTILVTCEEDALAVLHPEEGEDELGGRKFILKPVGMEDGSRADMTLLPRACANDTRAHIRKMKPTVTRPFVLQRFIDGKEYCTHALIVNNHVKTFTACESADILMHYMPLPVDSALYRAMLQYTQVYVRDMRKLDKAMTGHFSIDFLVEDEGAMSLVDKLCPIECNPRAHTAVVLLNDENERMSEAYLSALPDHDPKAVSNGKERTDIVTSKSRTAYYWIGHDLITRLVLPIFDLLRLKIGIRGLIWKWSEFAWHVWAWKDGTWEIWDPWPFWWLYAIYWPTMFTLCILRLMGLVKGNGRWSRMNVSTLKMFAC